MAIPSFFKQNKPRGFNYVPRYYDPAKEEMEQKRRAWNAQKNTNSTESDQQGDGQSAQPVHQQIQPGTGQPYRSRIMRGDMTNYFHRRKEQVERHTMIRILVIIIVMVLAIYLYLRF
jgi:hypothetical protein